MKLLPVLLVLLMVSVGQAATITVNSITDDSDGNCSDGSCTLRDAILVAVDHDTIDFSVTGTIVLASSLPTIEHELYIQGPGQENLAISGNDLVQPFNISSYSNGTTISNLSIINGRSGSTGGAVDIEFTSIVFNHVTFFSNYSTSFGGAIAGNNSTVELNNCIFLQNTANSGGGAINFHGNGPDLFIKNSSFTENTSNNNGGGAIMTQGKLIDISNSVFQGNQVQNEGDGGAIYTHHSTDNQPRAVTITGSTFSNNSAEAGGAIYLTIAATIKGSLFDNNSALSFGGAIKIKDNGVRITDTDIFIQNSTFSLNSAADSGGAIDMETYDTKLYVSNSTIVDNLAQSDGSGGTGGGFYIRGDPPGEAHFKNTIMVNNRIRQWDSQNSIESFTENDCYHLSAWLTTNGSNFVEFPDSCLDNFNHTSDDTGNAPDYLPLADNGGSTKTHALTVGSIAIDSGFCTNNAGETVSVDQRNMLRHDGDCDAGAYEYGGILAGDFNNDQNVDLTDLIISLQITTGATPSGIHAEAAIDPQKKIGTEEAIYVLQQIVQ